MVHEFIQKIHLITACDIWSPVRVTIHFSWSWGIVSRYLSCLRPSLPLYNGTGNRFAHSWKWNYGEYIHKLYRNVVKVRFFFFNFINTEFVLPQATNGDSWKPNALQRVEPIQILSAENKHKQWHVFQI